MQISVKIVNLAIITLIYVSVIESQPYRNFKNNGLPIDDLVAAIATAAMNGVIPLHKMNLGNPNRKGEALRIPILLIRPNDLRGIKSGKMKFSPNDRPFWNGRGPRNGRDFYKKDYSPKPKFPTHGLKVVAAPKLEFNQANNKRQFDKKLLNAMNQRFNDQNRELDDERYDNNNNNHRNQFQHRINEERLNRNRLNNYNSNEKLNDKFNERLPIRQSENWQDNSPAVELPEKERPMFDDYDDRSVDSMPQNKPVIKVPTIVRHVYGAKAVSDEKPTIPPRYLKSLADIPSASSSSSEKYDNNNENNRPQISLSKIPPISEIMPPINDQGLSYKTEPVVTHKFVNLGDVYRKDNNDEEVYNSGQFPLSSSSSSFIPSSSSSYSSSSSSSYSSPSSSSYSSPSSSNSFIPSSKVITTQSEPEEDIDDPEAGPLAGYAKDQYDKQLVSTLTKLMQSSKNRHPLNIGGLEGSDTKSVKPATKQTTKYFSSSNGQSSQTSSFRDDLFSPKTQSNYNPIQSTNSAQPQSQYTLRSSQSKIPESILSPLSFSRSQSSSGSQGLVNNENLSAANNRNDLVQLKPGQVPLLPEVNRKPVSLDLDYNTAVRPLSVPDSYFESADDYGSSQSYTSNAQSS